jgi:hypothetical protein
MKECSAAWKTRTPVRVDFSFRSPIAAINVDSDEAYQTAAAKSADYMKKHPDVPISFVFEQPTAFQI